MTSTSILYASLLCRLRAKWLAICGFILLTNGCLIHKLFALADIKVFSLFKQCFACSIRAIGQLQCRQIVNGSVHNPPSLQTTDNEYCIILFKDSFILSLRALLIRCPM